MKRLVPQRDLPPYAFVPGQNPHPEKPGGHMEHIEVEVSALREKQPEENQDYLFGLDLFNHGYYWESHVWWEALWNKAGRKGPLADFLKGLIKISAAGVKFKLGSLDPTRGHIDRAIELLEPLEKEYGAYCGLDLNKVIGDLRKLRESMDFSLKLEFLRD